ncbi:MAG: hypothetical protein HYX87_08250 [Chloroflexi bacterium]|nr:hypothetical protein [Chloroflexota bacterium]
MASEMLDSNAVETAYREQFRHLHHIDQLALYLFVLSGILSLAFVLFTSIVTFDNRLHEAGVLILMLVISAGTMHALIVNVGDYWVTFIVIGLLTRGLGLVQRGVFPVSLLAQFPTGFFGFVRRLLGGYRGPLIVMAMASVWYSGFEGLSLWLGRSVAIGLAVIPALLLGAISATYSYRRLRRQMAALRAHEEVALASRDDLIARHCDLASALLCLDPPRLAHAQRQYELALQLEPGNERAKAGLQRLASWQPSRRLP